MQLQQANPNGSMQTFVAVFNQNMNHIATEFTKRVEYTPPQRSVKEVDYKNNSGAVTVINNTVPQLPYCKLVPISESSVGVSSIYTPDGYGLIFKNNDGDGVNLIPSHYDFGTFITPAGYGLDLGAF